MYCTKIMNEEDNIFPIHDSIEQEILIYPDEISKEIMKKKSNSYKRQ